MPHMPKPQAGVPRPVWDSLRGGRGIEDTINLSAPEMLAWHSPDAGISLLEMPSPMPSFLRRTPFLSGVVGGGLAAAVVVGVLLLTGVLDTSALHVKLGSRIHA